MSKFRTPFAFCLLLVWLVFSFTKAPVKAWQNQSADWKPLTQLQRQASYMRVVQHGNALFGWGHPYGLHRSDDGGLSWERVTGLSETGIVNVFSFGGKLFAALVRGLVVSADNGASWNRVGVGFISQVPQCFLAHSNSLFIGTHDVGIFRSDDGGTTWQRFFRGLPDNGISLFFEDLIFSGPNLVAATGNGVFLSSDNGETWREPQGQLFCSRERIDENGLPAPAITGRCGTHTLLPDGNALLAATNNGIMRSTDNGETWQESNAGLTTLNSTQLSAVGFTRLGTRLFVSTFFGGLFCSDDNGRNWRRCQTGLKSNYPFRLFTLGDMVYANTQDTGLHVSANRGENWQPQAFPQFTQTTSGPVRALTFQANKLFALTNGGGLHVSTDSGVNWAAAGVEEAHFHALAPDGTSLYKLTQATANTVSTLERSLDGGGNWHSFLPDGLLWWNGLVNPNFRAPGNLNAIARIGAHLYIGTEQAGIKIAYNVDAKEWVGKYLDALKSTPAKAWTAANTGLTNMNVVDIVPFDNRVFAATKGGVFVSSDEGRNWTAANTGLTNFDLVVLAASATHLYAVTTGGLFISANRGQSWTAANVGLSDLNLQAFAVNGTNLFVGTSSGVNHSSDNGQSWRAFNDGLSERNVTALLINGTTLYAGTQEGRVFATGLSSTPVRAATNVSAASYEGAALAPASIVSVFGTELATATRVAAVSPLPTTLAGTTVKVKDSVGTERSAELFFVSPTQINYLLPAESAYGTATVTIASSDGKLSQQSIVIAPVTPGLFTADATGRGLAAAVVLRVNASGQQSYEPAVRFDTTQNRFVAVPIDLGAETDQVFLLLYGTGWRFRSNLTTATARLGGIAAPVLFAGAAPGFFGLDQINVRLPRSLSGRSEITITSSVDGKTANDVQVRIK